MAKPRRIRVTSKRGGRKAQPDYLDPAKRFYRDHLTHPDGFRKVAWRTRWGQELRFEVLLEVMDRAPRGRVSVLDVGCGLGDLAGYMDRRGMEVDYLGVDILPEMVQEARRRYPGHRFEVMDILKGDPPGAPFDYVLASGALTVVTEDHERFLEQMISRMLDLARVGLAFNMQNERHRKATPHLGYDPNIYVADPVEVYDVVRGLCPRVILREDFLPTDFAILAFPGGSRSLRGYEDYLSSPTPREDREVGLAYLYLEQKLPGEALRVLEDAPPTADAHNYRALALMHLGRFADAIPELEASLGLDREQVNAWVNLGTCLSKVGDRERAIESWREALAREPGNDLANAGVARALLQLGRLDEAMEAAQAVPGEVGKWLRSQILASSTRE